MFETEKFNRLEYFEKLKFKEENNEHLHYYWYKILLALSHRLKKGKELRKEADISEVEKNIHLIRAPGGNCTH